MGSEIDEAKGRRLRIEMRALCRLALIGLLISLLAAGCANSDAASDKDRHGSFYGGISGGGTWP